MEKKNNEKYASTTIISSKKDIFRYWIEESMYSKYISTKKRKKLDKYNISIFKNIFDIFRYIKNFNTLDLIFGYYQLPLKERNRHKKIF